jgi:hypothetical protein
MVVTVWAVFITFTGIPDVSNEEFHAPRNLAEGCLPLLELRQILSKALLAFLACKRLGSASESASPT